MGFRQSPKFASLFWDTKNPNCPPFFVCVTRLFVLVRRKCHSNFNGLTFFTFPKHCDNVLELGLFV